MDAPMRNMGWVSCGACFSRALSHSILGHTLYHRFNPVVYQRRICDDSMIDLLREVFIVSMDSQVAIVRHSKGRSSLLFFRQSDLAARADSRFRRAGFQALDGCEVQLSGLPDSFKRELEALNG